MRVNYYFSLSVIILLFYSCSNSSSDNESEISTSRYSKLENSFQDFKNDTLYVYSHLSPDGKDFPFKGAAMDSIQVSLLPYEIKYAYHWNKDFGACYKFIVDKSNIALIARTSGEYESSRITLLLYNLEKDSIVKTYSLADSWGDAGDTYIHNSCIIKDKDGYSLITYNYSSYDHSVEDVENDTVVEIWKNYSLCKLKNSTIDTLSIDSAKIVSQYYNIIKKLETY